MITFIFALLFAGLTIASVALQKTYAKLPAKELRRRAQKGDELAAGLFKAVGYGASLDVLLWIIIALSAGTFTVVLASALPDWLAVFGCAAVLWLAFSWLPNTRVSNVSQKAAKQIAPALAWVLNRLYPLLNRIGNFVQRHRHITVHSGLYQKEDLVELMQRQQHQPDNRMTAYELGIVKSALTFSDYIIRDVMTPRRVVKTVNQTDSIGPVLMTELHKTGFSRFPVLADKAEHVVGTLYLRDLVNVKEGGTVKDHMKKTVIYVNEEKPLQHALQAFLKTKHHMFIVVNGFEEIVGIITIEDVLEKIVGKQIVDEFDKYEDLRAVAALQAKQDAKAHTHAPEASSEKPDSTKTESVSKTTAKSNEPAPEKKD